MPQTKPSEHLARLVNDPGDEVAWSGFVDSLADAPPPGMAEVEAAVYALCEQADELAALRVLMAVGARLASPACDEVYGLAYKLAVGDCLDLGLAAEVRDVWTSKGLDDGPPASVLGANKPLRWEARVADAVRQAGMTRDSKQRAELYAEAAYCVYTSGAGGQRGEARAALLRQATSWLEESSRQAAFAVRSARLWERVLLEEGRSAELLLWLQERTQRSESRFEAIRARFVIARIHKQNTRDLAASMDAYRGVLAIAPGHAPAMRALVALYTRAKAWDELAAFYQTQFEAPGIAPQGRDALARALARLARDERALPEEAAHWYEVLRAVEPTDDEALPYLRAHFTSAQQWGKLRRAVEEAMLLLQGEGDPREAGLRAELLQLQELARAEDSEVQSARASWRATPGDAAARNALLASYDRAGRTQEALEVLQRECELVDDSHPDTPALLAQLHRALKEKGLHGPELRRVLERRRRIDSGNVLVLRELVVLYEAAGREEDAALIEEDLAASAQTPAQSSEFLRASAVRRFARLGDVRGAVQCLHKALRANPSDTPARVLFMQYAQTSGQYAETITWLRERVASPPEGADGATDTRDLVAQLALSGATDAALHAAILGLAKTPADAVLSGHACELALSLRNEELYETAASADHAYAATALAKHERAIQAARVFSQVFGKRPHALRWFLHALEFAPTRADVLTELQSHVLTDEDVVRVMEWLQTACDDQLAASFAAKMSKGSVPPRVGRISASNLTLRPGDSVRPSVGRPEAYADLKLTLDLPSTASPDIDHALGLLDAEVLELIEHPTSAKVSSVLARALGLSSSARAFRLLESRASLDVIVRLSAASELVFLAARLSSDERAAAARLVERMVLTRSSEPALVDCAESVLHHSAEATRYRRVMRVAVDACEQLERKRGLLVRWVEAEEGAFDSKAGAMDRARELVQLFPNDRALSLRYGAQASRSGEHKLALAALLQAQDTEQSPAADALLRLAGVAESAGNDEVCIDALCKAAKAGASLDHWGSRLERRLRVGTADPSTVERGGHVLVAGYEEHKQWLDAARVHVMLAERAPNSEEVSHAFQKASESAKRGQDTEAGFSYALRAALELPEVSEGWWGALVDATTRGRLAAFAQALDIALMSGKVPGLSPELEWDFREALVTRAMSGESSDSPWVDRSLLRMLVMRPQSEWAQELLLSRLAITQDWVGWVNARVSFAEAADTEDEQLNHIEQAARVCLDNLANPARALEVLAEAPDGERADLFLFPLRAEVLQAAGDPTALRGFYMRLLELPTVEGNRLAARRLLSLRHVMVCSAADQLRWLGTLIASEHEGAAASAVLTPDEELLLSELLHGRETEAQTAALILDCPASVSSTVRASAYEARGRSASNEADRLEDYGSAWSLLQLQDSLSLSSLKTVTELLRLSPDRAEPLDVAERYFSASGALEMFAKGLAHGAVRLANLSYAEHAARVFSGPLESPAAARRVWESFCDAGHISERLRREGRERWMELAERTGRASDADALLERTLEGGRPMPGAGDVLERLARLRAERLGDKAGAARVWKLVLDTDATNPRALAEVQEMYEREGDDVQLADLLERRAPLLPGRERERVYVQWLAALGRTRQYERAVAAFLQAADLGLSVVDMEATAVACAESLGDPERVSMVLAHVGDDERVPMERRIWALERQARHALSVDHEHTLSLVRRALRLDPQARGARAILVDLMAYPDVAGEASATLLPFVQATGDLRAVRATLDTFLLHSAGDAAGDTQLEIAFAAAESVASGAGLPYARRGLGASLADPERARVWSMRISARVGAADAQSLGAELDGWLPGVLSTDVAATLSRLGLELAPMVPNEIERTLKHLVELEERGAATPEEHASLLSHLQKLDAASSEHAALLSRCVSVDCWAALAASEEEQEHFSSARDFWMHAALKSEAAERMRFAREALRACSRAEPNHKRTCDAWLLWLEAEPNNAEAQDALRELGQLPPALDRRQVDQICALAERKNLPIATRDALRLLGAEMLQVHDSVASTERYSVYLRDAASVDDSVLERLVLLSEETSDFGLRALALGRILASAATPSPELVEAWVQARASEGATAGEFYALLGRLPVEELRATSLDLLLAASGDGSVKGSSAAVSAWLGTLAAARLALSAPVLDAAARTALELRLLLLRGNDAGAVAAFAESMTSPNEQQIAWRAVTSSSGATLEHFAALLRAEARMGDIEGANDALTRYERSARPKPKELAVLRRVLGEAFEAEGNTTAAHAAYELAFNADPTHVPTLWRLAELNVDLSRWPDAKRCYRALLLQKWLPESGRTREDIYAELEKIERELNAAK